MGTFTSLNKFHTALLSSSVRLKLPWKVGIYRYPKEPREALASDLATPCLSVILDHALFCSVCPSRAQRGSQTHSSACVYNQWHEGPPSLANKVDT